MSERERRFKRDLDLFRMANPMITPDGWVSGPPLGPPPGKAVLEWNHPQNFGIGLKENETVAVDRNKYDVDGTYDEVVEAVDAAVSQVARIFGRGFEYLNLPAARSVQSVLNSLVTIKDTLANSEYHFAELKPEPLPKLNVVDGVVTDENGFTLGVVEDDEAD